MEWQPIETAPKDGSAIIMFMPPDMSKASDYHHVSKVGEGLWDEDNEWRWANDSCSCCWGRTANEPTHWMPLPEPPK